MKNMLFLYVVAALLTASASCQKGEEIRGIGFGQLKVSSVFSGDASPLLLQVDGEIKDTLTVSKPATLRNIFLPSGQYTVRLVNQQTKAVLLDTALTIEASKITRLPDFFYLGTAAVFDDFSAKPDTDSMLVRFITLDPALPDEMDLTFSFYDFDQMNIPLAEKRINGIRKDRFSSFIQLPDPAVLFPDAPFIVYAIEGYKAGTNEKVMDIANGTYSYIALNGFQFFIANGVGSMGIGPLESGIHSPVEIFFHLAD